MVSGLALKPKTNNKRDTITRLKRNDETIQVTEKDLLRTLIEDDAITTLRLQHRPASIMAPSFQLAPASPISTPHTICFQAELGDKLESRAQKSARCHHRTLS
jgi:hypothetical protein